MLLYLIVEWYLKAIGFTTPSSFSVKSWTLYFSALCLSQVSKQGFFCLLCFHICFCFLHAWTPERLHSHAFSRASHCQFRVSLWERDREVSSEGKSPCGTIRCGREQAKKSNMFWFESVLILVFCDKQKGLFQIRGHGLVTRAPANTDKAASSRFSSGLNASQCRNGNFEKNRGKRILKTAF